MILDHRRSFKVQIGGTKWILGHSLCALVLILMTACSSSSAPGSGSLEAPSDHYIIGPSTLLMPKGAFLLVRKDRNIGAVRFTKVELTSDVGVGKAAYESYFKGDSGGSFSDRDVIRKQGLIDLKPLVGIGHLAFQPGQNRVDIGPWSFGCSHPGSLNMWPYRGDEKDYGYEFAPTSAQSVTEINVADKRLRWFRFDPDASASLPLSELPK